MRCDQVIDLERYPIHQRHSNAYRDTIEDRLHLALVRGSVDPEKPFLVRVHVQNPLSDVVSIHRPDFGMPLRTALAEIDASGAGLVLAALSPRVEKVLSIAMLLDHIGWQTAATDIRDALQATVRSGTVTYDLARQISGAQEVKCSEFARSIVKHMD